MNSPETVTTEAHEAQLAALQAEVQELRAENARLRDENQRLREELKALKQAPFKPRRRRKSQRKDPTQRQQQGRKAGHAGNGRSRPTHIDRKEYIAVGDHCPDCGEPLTGEGVKRERVIEDIEPVRPTQVTCYEIERRWCPCCHTYKEAPVADALPRHRLGLNVMLFVVYQKVALGLSYGKIRRELATYFGLQVSKGQLSNIVAEVADLFGPAYARLIDVLRQQSAVHVDQ
jgi:FtsZ-binding cell division protein ZapB